MQFTCSSVDESSFTSIMSEMKFCKSTEFPEMKNAFTRLTNWKKVRDNKLSSWLKVITDNDNNMKICHEKVNCICEREDWWLIFVKKKNQIFISRW